MVIGKAKTITPTVLSKFIDLEKGSLTTLIDSLEEKDMIKRSDDPNDRRKVWISLTSKGIEQMQIIEEQSRKGLAQMISNLDENEIVEICTSLNSLTRLFRKAMEDNGQRGDSVHETTRI
jgi:DNA-binding MarR family transcriptional regulator